MEPPRGSAMPPRGSVEPPRGSTQMPRGSAEPRGASAEPPRRSTETPRQALREELGIGYLVLLRAGASATVDRMPDGWEAFEPSAAVWKKFLEDHRFQSAQASPGIRFLGRARKGGQVAYWRPWVAPPPSRFGGRPSDLTPRSDSSDIRHP